MATRGNIEIYLLTYLLFAGPGDPDVVSCGDQPRSTDSRGILQPQPVTHSEGHRPPVPAHHQDPEVTQTDRKTDRQPCIQ